MFRIDTGQPRTDIYATEPLDLSIAEKAAEEGRAQQFAEKQAKQKEAFNRESDVATQLAGLGKFSVLPREQKMFADEQAALVQDIKNNYIAKIKAGDTAALLEAQQKINALNTKAELSSHARTQLDNTAKTIMAKGKDNYRKSSLAYVEDFSTNPKYNGVYDYFNPANVGEKFSFDKYVREKLVPEAQKFAQSNQKGYRQSYTKQMGRDRLAREIQGNEHLYAQAEEDFNDAKDKLGAKNPVEYIQNKYESDFEVNKTLPVPQWIADPNINKNPYVTDIKDYTDGGGQVHVMNPTTNEDVTVFYDENQNVVGGVQKTRLTPAEAAENSKVKSSNIAKKKLYESELETARRAKASLGPDATPEEIAVVTEMIPDINSEQFRQDPMPFQEKDIQLSPEDAQKIAYDKFKIKPKEIIQGKKPANANVQTVPTAKNKPAEKKGKTVSVAAIKAKVGTKGFEGYSEKELIDYYKSQGYTIQ